jgi:hypothetical protein
MLISKPLENHPSITHVLHLCGIAYVAKNRFVYSLSIVITFYNKAGLFSF